MSFPRAARSRSHSPVVVLVIEVAKHLFEDVFQRDDADRRVVTREDNSHITPARLQESKHAQQRIIWSEELLRVQNAHHLTVAANRQSRVR